MQETKSQISLSSDGFSQKLQHSINNVIDFSGKYSNYCVGSVDIVDSTKITARLSKEEICKYYSVFLNGMSAVAKSFDAKVVKNIGDCLLFYFPKTADCTKLGSPEPIECGLSMAYCSGIINEKLHKESLPSLRYRISLDYGTIMLAKTSTSSCEDIFGATVNVCAKINHYAKPLGLIIGHDLYQITRNFHNYNFAHINDYSVGLKYRYPVYDVTRKY